MVDLTDEIGVEAILFLKRTISKRITRDRALKIWQSFSEPQKVLMYDCYNHVRLASIKSKKR